MRESVYRKRQIHLFDFFHRENNVGEIQGSEIGLAVIKRPVDIHDGLVEFSSK